jgi:hypothetical protein
VGIILQEVEQQALFKLLTQGECGYHRVSESMAVHLHSSGGMRIIRDVNP